MKKIFTLLLLSVITTVTFAQQNQQRTAAAFTPGNLVILRIGDGLAAVTSGVSAPIFLDEYTLGGTLVQSIAMPTVAAAGNFPVSLTTSSGSEGLLTLSPNGQFLTFAAYGAAPGLAAASGTTSAATPRVVAVVNASGVVNTTTALSDMASGSSPRSAVTTNGTDLWAAGGAGGVRYATLGSTTSTQLSTTVTNMRSVMIFNGQLYAGDNSGTVTKLGKVGTGLPTTAGQTIANLNNVSITYSAPNQFYFTSLTGGANNADGYNTLYIADDGAGVPSPGIKKYTWNAGTSVWDSTGIIDAGSTNTYRGLAGRTTGNSVALFGARGSNGIYAITDNSGYGVAPTATGTLLIAPAANTAIRGVAFSTGTTLVFPLSLLSFNAVLNNNAVNLSWATTNELNTSGFEIQRSANGKDFNTISTVSAKGSISTNNYSLLDEKAFAGTNYYRLKMTEKDGSLRYSQIVTVKTKSVGVGVYPNPVKSELTIQHEAGIKGATISVVNFEGKQVLNTNVQIGAIQTSLDASKLAPGTYMVIYNNNGERTTKQFVKQ
jgi:hypothetical protein